MASNTSLKIKQSDQVDPDRRTKRFGGANLTWHHPAHAPFGLAGFAWFEQDKGYRRLPCDLSESLPEAVVALAQCPARGQIRFQSNSKTVCIRVKLSGTNRMVNMPATARRGFDLYIGEPLPQRYYNTATCDHTETAYEATLFDAPDQAAMRHFTLNFPLYHAVEEVLVGLDVGATILPPPPYDLDGCVVVYGTSITQGCCASRPGMAYTNILSRRLNCAFVNLGFSGNGRGDPQVARVMRQVPNPRLFVLDYDANCPSLEKLEQTLPRFIGILREQHRDVPILVVSRIRYARDNATDRPRRCALQKNIVATLAQKYQDRHLHFLDGATLLGEDHDECTVDGVHPNDLGFMRMARALEPVYRHILYGVDDSQKPMDCSDFVFTVPSRKGGM